MSFNPSNIQDDRSNIQVTTTRSCSNSCQGHRIRETPQRFDYCLVKYRVLDMESMLLVQELPFPMLYDFICACHDRPDMAYLFFFIFLYFPSSIARDPVPSPLSSLLTRFLRMSGLYLQTLTRTPMPLRSPSFHSIITHSAYPALTRPLLGLLIPFPCLPILCSHAYASPFPRLRVPSPSTYIYSGYFHLHFPLT